MQSNQNRQYELDVIRVVATMLVILIHTKPFLDAHFTESIGLTWEHHIMGVVIDVAVPLFVCLSGALLLRKPIEDIGLFFKRRFTRVLIPFVIWSVVVVGIYAVTDPSHSISELVVRACTTGATEAYWFVFMLLGLYLIAPILNVFVQHAKPTMLTYAVCIVGVLAMACQMDELQSFDIVGRFASRNLAFIGYFLAGYWLLQQKGRWSSALLFCVVAVLMVIRVAGTFINIPFIGGLNYPIVLALFLAMAQTSYSPRAATQQVVGFISEVSYGVYLMQVIIIRALLTIGCDKLPVAIEPFVVTLSTAVICVTALWVCKKMKLRWLY